MILLSKGLKHSVANFKAPTEESITSINTSMEHIVKIIYSQTEMKKVDRLAKTKYNLIHRFVLIV